MPEPGDRASRASVRDDLANLRIDRSAPAKPESGRRRAPLLLGVALAVLGLAILGIWLWGGAVPVQIAYAKRADGGSAADARAPVLSGSGYVVTGEKYISIGVRVAGRIDAFLVDEADTVTRGQPLVQLDNRDYEANLQRAEAALAVARANLNLRLKELARLIELRERDFASQADLDVKENEVAVARAQIDQLQAEVALARVNLDYTVLRAPTDGVILAKLKEVGEMAVPGGFAGSGDLIRMANLQDLRAEVDVNEADLSRVRLGQPAEVVPDAYPSRAYAARVVKLYPQINRQKGTLKVEVKLEEPDPFILPDMSVRITFLGDPTAAVASGGPGGAVLAPRASLRSSEDGAFVWVVAQGRARRRDVTTGASLGSDVLVASGLLGGEALVVGEAPDVTDGARVEIRE